MNTRRTFLYVALGLSAFLLAAIAFAAIEKKFVLVLQLLIVIFVLELVLWLVGRRMSSRPSVNPSI